MVVRMKRHSLKIIFILLMFHSGYSELFERIGSTYIITREHIREMHAINLYDILENVPGLMVERNGFASTLADLKTLTTQTYREEAQVILEIDGASVSMPNADRVYLNNISINDIERIEVHSGGSGLFGGKICVKIFTANSFISDPQSHFYYETGPFDLNVLHFNFQRRIGAQTGMYLSMEKSYMLEGLGMVHNQGAPYQYSQPGQIVDIYRAFLGRPDSLYVSDGYAFESFNRNWTIKLHTIALPGVSVGVGYQYSRDYQDDYRDNLLQNGAYLNFGSWHASDKLRLDVQSHSIGDFTFSGQGFSEISRITLVKDPYNENEMDTSSGRQGINAYGGYLLINYNQDIIKGSMKYESRMNEFYNCENAPRVHNDALEMTASLTPSVGKIPGVINMKNTVRRDSRYASATLINNRVLFSPSLDMRLYLPKGFTFDADYGCDRRYLYFSSMYFTNPKIRHLPQQPVTFASTKAYTLSCGLGYRTGRIDVLYRISDVFTKSPAILQPFSDDSLGPAWFFSSHSLSFISQIGHTVTLGYSGNTFSDQASLVFVQENLSYFKYGLKSNNSFYFRNVFRASKVFSEGKMRGRLGLYTIGRPDIYCIDFYNENNNNLSKRGRFLSFNLELEFRIKMFTFFSRLENISNQVISYQPGYYLPGPLIRWGFDWSFGN